ncbi:PXA domain [Teratosphaeria destructans]|uniref:PXA domain n=1 Tax=Teratosphaeria destructans TaxID=418781 RepID=A0A9W7SXN5_9PEZI|nr:PXA domain [Teratosphaeria destructans]
MAPGERPTRLSRHTSRVLPNTAHHEAENVSRASNHAHVADKETVAFIRRTLCARSSEKSSAPTAASDERQDQPLDELLPPLTSDNAVDVQLYAIIAVILSQFVQSWYSRITTDSDFVSEIVLIIAHCTRGIEERLRHVDLESLLLDELPLVIKAHISAVQTASDASCEQQCAHAQPASIASIYHSLRPHKALSPLPIDDATTLAERENESDWSQLLVSRIIPLVLPPEDLVNPCLNVLVSEIFSEMIVRNAVLEKSSQPWLLWEGVTKVIYTLRPVAQPRMETAASSINRLDQYGLLASAEKGTGRETRTTAGSAMTIVTEGFWSCLQFAVLTWALLRTFVVALMQASSIPPRPRRLNAKSSSSPPDGYQTSREFQPVPIIAMELWNCLGQLTCLQYRMPWLTGILALLQWQLMHGPGQLCSSNSALDRLMSAQIQKRLLSPALLPPLLQAIRSAVFPDNTIGPARVPPTIDEVKEIKRKCTCAIVEVIPDSVKRLYFATKDENEIKNDVQRTLDVFADAYVNKHLLVAALELIIVRLFPELAEPDISA